MRVLVQDFRFAFRRLNNSPRFPLLLYSPRFPLLLC